MDTTRSPDINDAHTPREPDPNATILTVQEAAWVLRMSVRTVRRRIAEGAPCSRRGKRAQIKIHRKDLDAYYEMDRTSGRRPRRPRAAA